MYRLSISNFRRFASIALLCGFPSLWAQPIYLGEHKICDGVSLKERPPPGYRISHEPLSGVLTISGDLEIGIAEAMQQALERYSPVSGIRLDSRGGNIYQGRAIAQLIESRSLDTYVENQCYSACTLAFTAGKRRFIGPEGELGFHGYGFANLLTPPNADPLKEQQRDLAWFAKRIHDQDFLDKIFDADCSTLWIPSRDELFAAGVAEPMEAH